MSIEELEAEALRLDPKQRARLAGRLLESLDELTLEENTRLWAEEAELRAADDQSTFTPADVVLREARERL